MSRWPCARSRTTSARAAARSGRPALSPSSAPSSSCATSRVCRSRRPPRRWAAAPAAVKSRAHRGLTASLDADPEATGNGAVGPTGPPPRTGGERMLTDDDVIADLARLGSAARGSSTHGEVPLTRRSAAATLGPVAAVAAVATLGAAAVVGTGHDGSGAGPGSTGGWKHRDVDRCRSVEPDGRRLRAGHPDQAGQREDHAGRQDHRLPARRRRGPLRRRVAARHRLRRCTAWD